MIKCKRDNIDRAGLSQAPTSGKKKKKKKKNKAKKPAFKTQKEFLAHLDKAAEMNYQPESGTV